MPLHFVAPAVHVTEQHLPLEQVPGHVVSIGVEEHLFAVHAGELYERKVFPSPRQMDAACVQVLHAVVPQPVSIVPHCAPSEEQVLARQKLTLFDAVGGDVESSLHWAVIVDPLATSNQLESGAPVHVATP